MLGSPRKRRRNILGATLVAVAALALSACTGEPVGGQAADGEAALPQKIVDSGVLRVGTEPLVGMPWTALEDSTNENMGIDPDLARAIGEELGLEVEFVNLSFDSLIPSLEADRIDVIMSDMLDTKERQGAIDFVDYVLGGDGLMVLADSKANPSSPDDLCGYTVGVLRGAAAHITIEEVTCDGGDAIEVQVFPDVNALVTALDSGRIEVASGDPSTWGYMTLQHPDQYRAVGEAFNTGPLGIGVPKGSPLADVLVETLNALIENGTYAEILDGYGMLESTHLNEATINKGQA